ncbi:hypothetical protein HGM15179_004224 [Zosterops borbonicus]|uniref:Uncharacterized protein n=1 Tax=Zosterops borbonicus TaxID=364589 RepID=A0A8K1GT30_9PASS|nr:hypothetical protein HGM15179_004224 [Zosterops borbonicus]
MHSDLELGPGGGGELLKGDEGQRKDSSFRTARQAGKRAAARARFLVILKMTDERQRQVRNKDRLRGDLQI